VVGGAAPRWLLGRTAAFERAVGTLDGCSTAARALLVTGPAGIGKTAVWRAVVEATRASGTRVLVARATEAEARLAYAGLGDLLEPVADALPDHLPAPQRRALEVALLRADPTPAGSGDWRATALGLAATLRELTDGRPVLVAIDDVQWLDAASVRVLRSALHRLTSTPVRLLASLRTGGPWRDPLELPRTVGWCRELHLAPLDAGTLDRIVADRLGTHLPLPVVHQLVRATDGNAFLTLELARHLLDRRVPLEPGRPVPLPEDLRSVLTRRLDDLSDDALEALLVLAVLARRELSTLRRVLGAGADHGLAEAASAGVVEVHDGHVDFSHPLLASAIHDATRPERRRVLHARIATATTDPEERARHLALAAAGPDDHVAVVLEDAAAYAAARGAPDSAAELAELAGRLTPDEQTTAWARRTCAAADLHFRVADPDRSRHLLRGVAAHPDGAVRAHALVRLAWHLDEDFTTRARRFREALEHAGDDRRLQTVARCGLSLMLLREGDGWDALAQAKAARQLAGELDDPQLVAQTTMAYGFAASFVDQPDATRLLEAAAADEAAVELLSAYDAVGTTLGLRRMWDHRLDDAEVLLERQRRVAAERGDESSHAGLLMHLSELAVRRGCFPDAHRLAREAHARYCRLGEPSASAGIRYALAYAQIGVGEAEVARRDAEQGLALARRNHDQVFELQHLRTLAFAALTADNHAAAHQHLCAAHALTATMPVHHLGIYPFVHDLAETAVACGDHDHAEGAVDELDAAGATLPWAAAMAARGRALVAAGRGEVDDACAHAEVACRLIAHLGTPFELARCRLLAGQLERRRRRKAEARTLLEAARDGFMACGATPWRARAEDELTRIGGARADGLSTTERRVAEAAAAGLTNREIADRLFLSVKTVESNLTRTYRKLGVRSRTELVRRLDPHTPEQTRVVPGSSG
jgi:DNA-binding CsgD family transcriptional regulator